MKLIAHRGGAGLRIENTLAAFEHALELGADGAELDVHLSRDGQVVVHHDDRLNSAYCRHASSGDWIKERERLALADMTYAQMHDYEIGSPRPDTVYARRFDRIQPVPDQRIPLLRDVIRQVKVNSPDFVLVIEIKASLVDRSEPWSELVDATLTILDEEDFFDRTILISFDWGALLKARDRVPDLKTWFLVAPLSWFSPGQPPIEDIPPAPDKLKAIREFYETGDAPWLAGYDPRRFQGSYIQATMQAGGHAWYPYHRDFTSEVQRESAAAGLETAAWTLNLKDRKELRRLADTGLENLVVDYPDERP